MRVTNSRFMLRHDGRRATASGRLFMADLVRFSVSLEADLLAEFDRFCAEGKLATRSEAIRQLLHEKLTASAWAADAADVAASLTLVYDHHRTHLAEKLV